MNIIIKILIVLTFFPSVTFGVMDAEIMPYGFIFALVILLSQSRVKANLLAIVWVMILWTLVPLLVTGDSYGYEAIRSFAAYMNFLLFAYAMLFLNSKYKRFFIQSALKVFLVLTLLGVFQYLGFLAPFQAVFELLVPRAEATALDWMGGRGVTLLSSEPARAGVEYCILYLVTREKIDYRYRWFTDILVFTLQLILFKSTSVLLFFGFALGVIYLYQYKFRVVFLAPVIVIIIIFSFPLFEHAEIRAVRFVHSLSNFDDLRGAFFFLAQESGHRILALYSFVVEGFYSLLGHGIGSWESSSKRAVLNTGIPWEEFRYFSKLSGNPELIGFRGPGIISNIMLDMGLVGLAVIGYVVSDLVRRLRVRKDIIFIVLFKIALIGSVGETHIWMMLFVISWSCRLRDRPHPVLASNKGTTYV